MQYPLSTMINKLIVLIALFHTQAIHAQDCGVCPNKKHHYRMKTHLHSDTELSMLAFEKVYLFSQEPNHTGAVGNFLVLSPNGCVYISCPLCALPDNSIPCNDSLGFFGTYKVKNNHIRLTLFSKWARYYHLYGEITKEGIILTHRKSRGSLSGKQAIPERNYLKTNLGYNCSFDWL